MSRTTHEIQRVETLDVRECPVCGVSYGLPQRLIDNRETNGGCWWCPNGHSLRFIETVKDKLAAERAAHDQTRAALDRAREARRVEERAHAATRGHLTRHKKRASGGVCPCCHRTFQQLARHMKSEHADFPGGWE